MFKIPDFSALETEFAKVKGYVAQGAALVNEAPAALDVAISYVNTFEGMIGSLKTSVAAASAAVGALVPNGAPKPPAA